MPFPAPEGFQHATPIQVRWADLDALGHVNNATYLTYLEQARIVYFNGLGLWDGSPDTLGLIMAKVVLEFLLPVVATDEVVVYTRCTRFGNKSFDTEQWVMRRASPDAPIERAAVGIVTIVVYDYPRAQSAPIPDEWRAKMTAFGER